MSEIILSVRYNFLMRIIVFSFLTVTAFTHVGKAQETEDATPLKVNTYLANLPITVSDKQGRNIAGLTKDNFRILQDGAKQPIEFFANEDAPMNVAILIDTSASTFKFLNNIKSAARTFLKILRPEDKAMIVSFDGKYKILCSLTNDKEVLADAVGDAKMLQMAGTSMYNAIYEIVKNKFGAAKGKKAIIVLTDGFESGNNISDKHLLRFIGEADTVVYPIIFKPKNDYLKDVLNGCGTKLITLINGQTISSAMCREKFVNSFNQHKQFIESLADFTGGKIYEKGSTDLTESFQAIADELKKQYLIGFYPQNIEDGKPHQITVEVDRENVVVRSKKRIKLDIFN